MNRRNFLGLITAAPAIVTSTGVFAGACDVWVPKQPDNVMYFTSDGTNWCKLTPQQDLEMQKMQKELYREIMQSSIDRRKLAIMARCHN